MDDIVFSGPNNAPNVTVASDLAVFRRAAGETSWTRYGTGLPLTTTMDLSVAPDGYIYAATHGRGIWKIAP
jgi:hypothetical protein